MDSRRGRECGEENMRRGEKRRGDVVKSRKVGRWRGGVEEQRSRGGGEGRGEERRREN